MLNVNSGDNSIKKFSYFALPHSIFMKKSRFGKESVI